jgi:hypothetical protein
MKTPMKELQEIVQQMRESGENDLRVILHQIPELIEKEKTQIKTAFNAGYSECENYSQDRTTNAEKYYTDTFEK